MRYLLGLMTCGMVIGCTTLTPLQKSVHQQSPYEVKNKSKSISVVKLVDTIEMNKVIGKYYQTRGCYFPSELHWRGNDKMLNQVSNMIRNKLEKYGYTLIGKAYSPFNEEYNKQSELLLGGKIADIQSNVCYWNHGVKGEVYIKIEWEIYNTEGKKIVLTLNTEGFSSASEFIKTGDIELYDKAFDVAINNFGIIYFTNADLFSII